MTGIETRDSRSVYSRDERGHVDDNRPQTHVPTLHRCKVCGNLFNRTMDLGSGKCFQCGKSHAEPVQGYLPDTRDLLIENGTHPVLLINVNGQCKMSKTGKVQIGTRWCECQEMTRSQVFNLHVDLRRSHDVIEVRDMGVQS